ncbi:glycosyltransferase family 2 protein [Candidatus Peregrinibacteria bacterium]|nr:glycosyltransferase family 2 protein [Candidatus Peregrinibacteria bacterium]
MQISVVIPTYNRSSILQECLQALVEQDLPRKDYEVIVVDDGSQDRTKEVAEEFVHAHDHIRYFHQKNQGQGKARNLGFEHAKGSIIVLINDDMIVRKDFLTQHLRTHLRHPGEHEVVLGLTLWHPRLEKTPLMNWLTNGSTVLGRFGGHQFAYEKLEGKTEADYNFFYTSNLSLKKSLLEKYPFDPAFSGYGWEDIELGYRLTKEAGMKLYYNKDAVGFHDHFLTEEAMKKRMYNIGKAAWIIHEKYPELGKVPSKMKQFAFWLFSNRLALAVLRMIRDLTQGHVTNFYYYALSKRYFLEGLHNR